MFRCSFESEFFGRGHGLSGLFYGGLDIRGLFVPHES